MTQQNLSFLPNMDELVRIACAKAWAAGHQTGVEYAHTMKTDIESAYHYAQQTNPHFTHEEQDALWTEAEYGRDISTAHKLRHLPRALGGSL